MKYFLILLFFIFSCNPSEPQIIKGCTASTACNFNPDANEDDVSCMYPDGTDGGSIQQSPGNMNYNCDGICIANIDCADECGGSSYADNCGVCDDDQANDCPNDCFGVPGGTAVNDCAGVCEGAAFKDCANNCCVGGMILNTSNSCSQKDPCGICDVNVIDVYPRLDHCDGNCSETTTYYYEEYNDLWEWVVYTEPRSCSDLQVLQQIIDLNIENGYLDHYSSIMDDAGNNNGIIETFEFASWTAESGFVQKWDEVGRLIELSLNMYLELPNTFGNLTALKKLTLQNNKLTSLPQSMRDLNNLEILEVNYNLITTIPEIFGDMTNLMVLKLDHNNLVELPETLGSLVNLELLNLSNNQLNTLPSNIGNLVSLKVFLLNNNQLATLPETIGDMNHLEELRIQDNWLVSLPSSIGNLASLTKLWLHNNQLISLPNNITVLSALEFLWLHYNYLETIPENIGDLSNLISLQLHHNQLGLEGSVPESMCMFFDENGNSKISFSIDNNLECPVYPDCINIMLGYQKCTEHCESGYMIGKGRVAVDDGCLHIADWSALQDIINENNVDYFTEKNVIEIVDEIHWKRDNEDPVTNRLIQLKLSDIEMTTIPQTIGDFDSLEILDLTNNRITGNIPESIERLRNLKKLKLNSNNLGCYNYDFNSACSTLDWAQECCIVHCDDADGCTGAIPSILFELENLEEINLSYNHLSSIPDNIGGLTNLKSLRINNNRIYSELPSDIIGLPNLVSLNIKNNEFFGVIPQEICSINLIEQALNSWFHNNNFCCPYPNCIIIGYQDPSECDTCD